MTGITTESVDMFAQLQTYINSRIPVVWLATGEEFRAERGIAKYARTLEWDGVRSLLGIWSLTGGQHQAGGWSEFDGWTSETYLGQPLPDDFYPNDPVGAKMVSTPHGGLLRGINWAVDHPTHPCILIVRDAHNFLSNDYWRRVLKDAEVKLRKTLTTIVCVSVSDELPQDLRRHVAYIRPGLPSLDALIGQISPTIKKLEIKADPRECAAALRGLTSQQALDLLTIDFSKHGKVDTSRLSKLKAEELASVHGVSFRGDSSDFNVVGGFDVFKAYMRKRRWAFGQEARDFGIDRPKGVVFIGVPGGGKTLMGAAAAGELGLPLIILNLSECEGGIVGETATRTAEALRTVDALSPCVVLVDEAEKIFGGQGNLDGGSRSGMMRLFLIWLQERTSETFTMITSNDISGMPPELTRRGRVDEIFWCDLPGKRDRQEILRIHLERRNRALPPKAMSRISAGLDGYTGSEIEQVVKEAHLSAYCRLREGGDGDLFESDLIEAAAPITPMAETYREKLGELRAWAKGRARPASEPDPDDKPRYVAETKPRGEVPAPGTPLFQGNVAEAW
jgi:hypothetical protein